MHESGDNGYVGAASIQRTLTPGDLHILSSCTLNTATHLLHIYPPIVKFSYPLAVVLFAALSGRCKASSPRDTTVPASIPSGSRLRSLPHLLHLLSRDISLYLRGPCCRLRNPRSLRPSCAHTRVYTDVHAIVFY